MMWTKEWTIESVEGNYKALGIIEREDVLQLIADAKELRELKTKKPAAYMDIGSIIQLRTEATLDCGFAWNVKHSDDMVALILQPE